MPKKLKPTINQSAIDEILIEELDVQDEELKPGARLIEDLGADPDTPTYIVVRLEDELNLSISEGAEEEFITVQDIYNCIRRATNKV
jgi:acyl carrier protein